MELQRGHACAGCAAAGAAYPLIRCALEEPQERSWCRMGPSPGRPEAELAVCRPGVYLFMLCFTCMGVRYPGELHRLSSALWRAY